jgi:tRNA (guanine10-N2)-methyltransferase
MIHEILDVFSESAKWSDLTVNCNVQKLQPTFGLKFKFVIDAVGRKIQPDEKIKMIELFSCFDLLNHNVDLKAPEVVYKILEITYTKEFFCGIQIAVNDSFHSKYMLKNRPYLGPTSTDHELAFLMANQA